MSHITTSLGALDAAVEAARFPPDEPIGKLFQAAGQLIGAVAAGSDERTAHIAELVSGELIRSVDLVVHRAMTDRRRRSAVGIAGVLSVAILAAAVAGAAGGYWMGWNSGESAEASVQAAVALDPAWLPILRANSGAAVVQACAKQSWVSGGRRACSAPLWLDRDGAGGR